MTSRSDLVKKHGRAMLHGGLSVPAYAAFAGFALCLIWITNGAESFYGVKTMTMPFAGILGLIIIGWIPETIRMKTGGGMP